MVAQQKPLLNCLDCLSWGTVFDVGFVTVYKLKYKKGFGVIVRLECQFGVRQDSQMHYNGSVVRISCRLCRGWRVFCRSR